MSSVELNAGNGPAWPPLTKTARRLLGAEGESGHLMSLNPGLVTSTFAYVEQQTTRATTYFYGRLFAENPHLRSMFPPAMNMQRDRLFSALVTIVRSLDDPTTLSAFLGPLGRDHRKFGVEPHHYDAVGSALLATIRRFAGSAWTTEAAEAWASAYQMAARMMIEAAEEHSAWTPPWWQAEVTDVEHPRPDLVRLVLRPNQPYPYLPGQYLSLQAARWPKIWRSYSIANAPRNDNLLRLVVRGVPGGWVSNALVNHTRLGDRVLLGPPRGSMVMDASSDHDLVFVAGGSGIAPVKAIIEQVVSLPERRDMLLLYGGRTRADLSEITDIARIQATCPWLRVVPVLEDPDRDRLALDVPETAPLGEGIRGRLPDALPGFGPFDRHDVYVCGPSAMVRATLSQLRAAGARPDRIFHDLSEIDHVLHLGDKKPVSPREAMTPPR